VRFPLVPVAVLALLSGTAVPALGDAVPAPESRPATTDIPLMRLASVRALFTAVARASSMTDGQRTAAWTDFSTMAAAVSGDPNLGSFTLEALTRALTTGGGPHVSATPGVESRDAAAFRLLQVGYSARETADVISGRISVTALDTAQRMLAVGRGREEAANYLDSQYKRVALARAMPLPRLQPAQLAGPFDALIEKYARLHGVEAAVVRAIMATESAFNSAAISSAGAVGLMQLMPMTARELGVNPFVPEQNVEGGVRYFAQLMKRFGGLEMALVAYNGGPGYALRFARGQAALYGETRDYVRKVLSRLAGSRARS
jgi:soluble lytic murein transglycosylase-like protein